MKGKSFMTNFLHQEVETYSVPAFQNLRKEFGLKPLDTRAPKKESQLKKFTTRHTCQSCKQPLTWVVGTNVCSCTNPKCQGLKRIKKNVTEGEDPNYYVLSYHTLASSEEKIAESLFGGK